MKSDAFLTFCAIYGSVPVARAPDLHAGAYQVRAPGTEVAQMHFVSQLSLRGCRFHFSICAIFGLILPDGRHGHFLGETRDSLIH